MGQSNMLGEGAIFGRGNTTLQHAVFEQGKFPWLKNGDTWSVSSNIRNVAVMANGNQTFNHSVMHHNEWLAADYCDKMTVDVTGSCTIGPELGIADFGGSFKQDNVMLLKSCIGNRGA